MLLCLAALAATWTTSGEAEVVATPSAIIFFDSKIFPRILPRSKSAPVGIRIEGRVRPRKNRKPPALTEIQLAIHRAARFSTRGLPLCNAANIEPASSQEALEACGQALIGHGRVRAKSSFPGHANFIFNGRTLLFNGRLSNGHRAILIHVFNPQPPTSFVFPFVLTRHRGTYGTVLTAHLRLGRWSRIIGFKLVLKRTFMEGGRRQSFLKASCPAPKGLVLGIAPFVRATLRFSNGTKSDTTVVSSCKVR